MNSIPIRVRSAGDCGSPGKEFAEILYWCAGSDAEDSLRDSLIYFCKERVLREPIPSLTVSESTSGSHLMSVPESTFGSYLLDVSGTEISQSDIALHLEAWIIYRNGVESGCFVVVNKDNL